jgi:hypothetical protein
MHMKLIAENPEKSRQLAYKEGQSRIILKCM